MLEKDILLNNSNDLEISNFDLVLTNDNEGVVQRIKRLLLTTKGEWFLDTDLGTPWLDDILGRKNSLDSIKSVLVNVILKVDSVQKIEDIQLNFDEINRKLNINIAIKDIFGENLEINI